MKEQLISIETAKLLHKVGGFEKRWGDVAYKAEDGKLYGDTGSYTDYPAPTQSLLQKWLREVHNIHVVIVGSPTYSPCVMLNGTNYWRQDDELLYEEALEKGLQEALKLIKMNK